MKALLLIDLQNDFCRGGALEVKDANDTIAVANRMMENFDLVVATQDWHPATHGSFAANRSPFHRPGQVVDLNGLSQVLWPIHCVKNTFGALFHKDLNVSKIDKVIQKGTDEGIDSYSGFFDNGHRKQTEMHEYLQSKGVTEVYVMGLATDYCVKFTALDAVALGYKTHLIAEGCRGVELQDGDINRSIAEMREKGIVII